MIGLSTKYVMNLKTQKLLMTKTIINRQNVKTHFYVFS